MSLEINKIALISCGRQSFIEIESVTVDRLDVAKSMEHASTEDTNVLVTTIFSLSQIILEARLLRFGKKHGLEFSTMKTIQNCTLLSILFLFSFLIIFTKQLPCFNKK